ncbi:MAG: hypothetical protein FGM54_11055, partial [Chitinophagaceae bacterium]|nr:hypothetical protein [Chitinophagaceae bacterium]
MLLSAAWRVINAHMAWYHLVPMAALGLFTGSILNNNRWAFLMPLAGMFLSDIGLSLFTNIPGFYGLSQVVNYAALAAVVVLGKQLQQRNAIKIGAYSIAGTLLFFIISNFGTYLSGYYGYSLANLRECYIMAIPFYKNEFATSLFLNSMQSDLIFSFVLF